MIFVAPSLPNGQAEKLFDGDVSTCVSLHPSYSVFMNTTLGGDTSAESLTVNVTFAAAVDCEQLEVRDSTNFFL